MRSIVMSSDDLSAVLEQLERMNDRMDELEAENQRLERENERLRNGEDEPEDRPEPPSNDEIQELWFEEHEKGNRKHHSLRNDRSTFNQVRLHTDDKPLPQLTEGDVQAWIDGANAAKRERERARGEDEPTGLSEATWYNNLSRLASIFDWMNGKEWGPGTDPARPKRDGYDLGGGNQQSFNDEEEGKVRLSTAEFTYLASNIYNKRTRAMLVLGVKTGFRCKQIALMKRSDVDIDAKIVYDHSPKGEGYNRMSDPHKHPIDEETVNALQTWTDRSGGDGEEWLFPSRKGGHLHPNTVGKAISKAASNVAENTDDETLADRLDTFTAHNLRHTFTQLLRDGDCPDPIIKELRADADSDYIDYYSGFEGEKFEGVVRPEYGKSMPSFGL
ncbi:hypothetical protein BRC90_10085 [Halobacteriales archaeon QS_4_69_34]|nr:MAG: hypothetical protein BRC90_10085 [Halobacteriales archaeon QS_4_69_34]